MARKSRVNRTTVAEALDDTTLAGHYGRLSVEDGDSEEYNSIGNQKKIAIHYLNEHPDIKLVDTYSDNGVSGMTYEREGFKRLMKDLQMGKINCIIVKDISRLGRHFLQTSELVERTLPEMGVRLICINDNYDSADPNCDAHSLTLPLKMILNDFYVQDISKKIRSGIDAKMGTGEFLPSAGSVPYGYVRNPETVTFDIDEETAPVVQRIFELRASGMNLSAIAATLNADGILCPGKLRYVRGITKAEKYENAIWIRGTVRKILSDEVYIGNRVHGRVKRKKLGAPKLRRSSDEWQIIEGTHLPIVSRELFDKVQEVGESVREERSNYRARNDVDTDYRDLLRGKVFCGDCGSSMSGTKGCARHDAKTPSRIQYDCNTYRYSSHAQCSSHYVRQEAIMSAISTLLGQQISVCIDVEQLADKIRKMPSTQAYIQAAANRHIRATIKRKQCEAKLDQILTDLAERIIDREVYERTKAKYQKELDYWVDEESSAQADKNSLEAALSSSKQWTESIRRYQVLSEIDRELIVTLIDKIEVFHDKRIKIHLTYADPYLPLNSFMDRLKEAPNVG